MTRDRGTKVSSSGWLTLPATRYEIRALVRDMRTSDKLETSFNMRRVGMWTPAWRIEADLDWLVAEGFPLWAIHYGPDLVALGGIRPDPASGRRGAIWMLGTGLADTEWRGLFSRVRAFIAAFAPAFPDGVGNLIPKHMPKRQAWMKHLGFDIQPLRVEDSLYESHVLAWMRPERL